MTNRQRGVLILAVLSATIAVAVTVLSQRPSPEKHIDKITAITVDEGGIYSVEAASKKIALLNQFYQEFPDEPRVETILNGIFTGMRRSKIKRNDALQLFREAEPISVRSSPSGYVHEIIKNSHGESLDPSFQPELLKIYEQVLTYLDSTTFLPETVLFAGLFPEENWRASIFAMASSSGKNQNEIALAKELVTKLGQPFSLREKNVRTNDAASLAEIPGNKVVLYIKKEFHKGQLRSMANIYTPSNSQLILLTEQTVDPNILESTSVPIFFPTTPLFKSNYDDLLLMCFLIDKNNHLIGIEIPHALSQYKFPE